VNHSVFGDEGSSSSVRRCPIGSFEGKYFDASARPITATFGDELVSLLVNVRPRTSGMPSASKNPSLTTRNCDRRLALGGGVGSPATSKVSSVSLPSKGMNDASAAARTVGMRRTRSSSGVVSASCLRTSG
jgi:hypothetical protein